MNRLAVPRRRADRPRTVACRARLLSRQEATATAAPRRGQAPSRTTGLRRVRARPSFWSAILASRALSVRKGNTRAVSVHSCGHETLGIGRRPSNGAPGLMLAALRDAPASRWRAPTPGLRRGIVHAITCASMAARGPDSLASLRRRRCRTGAPTTPTSCTSQQRRAASTSALSQDRCSTVPTPRARFDRSRAGLPSPSLRSWSTGAALGPLISSMFLLPESSPADRPAFR